MRPGRPLVHRPHVTTTPRGAVGAGPSPRVGPGEGHSSKVVTVREGRPGMGAAAEDGMEAAPPWRTAGAAGARRTRTRTESAVRCSSKAETTAMGGPRSSIPSGSNCILRVLKMSLRDLAPSAHRILRCCRGLGTGAGPPAMKGVAGSSDTWFAQWVAPTACLLSMASTACPRPK